MTEEIVEFKDFSRPPRQVKFQVGGQSYEALPALPIGLAMDLASLAQTLGTGDVTSKIGAMWELFEALLQDDGGQRFKQQAYDKRDPLDLPQTLNVMNWLLEVYGLRPTGPSSDSSTGSTDTDTSSTDGAPGEESTHSS